MYKQETYYSIILLILGVAMVYYSSRSIDSVLIKFGYKKDEIASKTRTLKKSK